MCNPDILVDEKKLLWNYFFYCIDYKEVLQDQKN